MADEKQEKLTLTEEQLQELKDAVTLARRKHIWAMRAQTAKGWRRMFRGAEGGK